MKFSGTNSYISVAIRITDPDTDPDTDRDTGKTCLGGGMHCPSASSLQCDFVAHLIVVMFAVCLLCGAAVVIGQMPAGLARQALSRVYTVSGLSVRQLRGTVAVHVPTRMGRTLLQPR